MGGAEAGVVACGHGGVEAFGCVVAAFEGHEAWGHEEDVELGLFLGDGVDDLVDFGDEGDVGGDEGVGSAWVGLAEGGEEGGVGWGGGEAGYRVDVWGGGMLDELLEGALADA